MAYPTDSVFAGKLVTLHYGDYTPGDPPVKPASYTKVGQVLNMDDLVISRQEWDVTTHGSSLFRERIYGLYEPIDINIEIIYTNGFYDIAWDLQGKSPDTVTGEGYKWWRLLYPDNTEMETIAFIANLTPMQPIEGFLAFKMKLATTYIFDRTDI